MYVRIDMYPHIYMYVCVYVYTHKCLPESKTSAAPLSPASVYISIYIKRVYIHKYTSIY